jgi:hypothetical protein
MTFVLAGALILVFVLGMGYAFTQANPVTLARSLRTVGALLLGLAAVALMLTERIGLGVFVGTVAWSLFTQGRIWPGGWPHYGGFPSGGSRSRRPRQDQSSAVRTEWIALELDHMTGEMDGEVLKGDHAGAQLSAMTREALMALFHESGADSQTRRLLETYLDRRFGGVWRQAEQTESQSRSQPRSRNDSAMSREEAYRVLGLEAGASNDEIRAAHRKLMLQNHPDKGGTSYLAAKINEAKDVLLG